MRRPEFCETAECPYFQYQTCSLDVANIRARSVAGKQRERRRLEQSLLNAQSGEDFVRAQQAIIAQCARYWRA